MRKENTSFHRPQIQQRLHVHHWCIQAYQKWFHSDRVSKVPISQFQVSGSKLFSLIQGAGFSPSAEEELLVELSTDIPNIHCDSLEGQIKASHIFH